MWPHTQCVNNKHTSCIRHKTITFKLDPSCAFPRAFSSFVLCHVSVATDYLPVLPFLSADRLVRYLPALFISVLFSELFYHFSCRLDDLFISFARCFFLSNLILKRHSPQVTLPISPSESLETKIHFFLFQRCVYTHSTFSFSSPRHVSSQTNSSSRGTNFCRMPCTG